MSKRPAWVDKLTGRWKAALSTPNDSPRKIFGVAIALCLVCSIVVSAAALGLGALQEANKQLEIRRNILQVAGLMQPGADIDELFKQIDARIVDLRSGEFTDAIDPEVYDQRKAARDPALSDALSASDDIAGIGRKAHYATIYLVKDSAGDLGTVIFPVHGYGLWSTLYGYLALKPDGREVVGLQFYEHAETPGLGGEIDNPRWRAQWPGKFLFDPDGALRIEVVKGVAATGPDEVYQVDGLAGATLTARGVNNLVRYWAGEGGFGPFLENLKEGRVEDD